MGAKKPAGGAAGGAGGAAAAPASAAVAAAVDPRWTACQPKIVEFYEANFPDKVEKIKQFMESNRGKEKKVVEGLLKAYPDSAREHFAAEAKVLEEESGI